VEGRLTRVLDAIEESSSDPLSYEGGRRTVIPKHPSANEYQDEEKSYAVSEFLSTFQNLRDRLISLPEISLHNTVFLRRGSEIIKTTGLREVYAAAFHSIHHFAIIGALLRELMGADEAAKYIPFRFGFKPKTAIRTKL
jgi:hypothetical protein